MAEIVVDNTTLIKKEDALVNRTNPYHDEA